MKIKLELFGASRDFSEKDYLEFNLKEKSSIKDLRQEILNFVDNNFKGNENYKKLVLSSTFCSEKNNIVSDNYEITKQQKIGIIPPIGGG
jgi:molybdopterin converting factor small subunit